MSTVLKISSLLKKIKSSFELKLFHQHNQAKSKPQIINRTNNVPVFLRATNFTERTALRDDVGNYSYGNVFMSAKDLSQDITKNVEHKTNEKVIFLCPNNANYVITQWAIWMSGQIAVPLGINHPESLLEYYCRDSNASLIITTPEYTEKLYNVAKACEKKLFVLDEKLQENATLICPSKQSDMEGRLSADFYNKNNAMILYTSGTTGNPKGVILSHKNLINQVNTLVDAWKWTENDTILHTLPLNHVHGIVNALLCSLYVGAKCKMLLKYDSNTVWSNMLGINAIAGDRKITVFMAVPTIYLKLIQEYERVFSNDPKMTEYIKTTLKNKVRLMVSGSAPLPTSIYNKWLEITGHKLLERYGMTEIGMCLSQTYDSEREPGYVGVPLNGVSIKLGLRSDECDFEYLSLLESSNINGEVKVNINNRLCENEDPVGELLVKSESVFKVYNNRPIQNEFTLDNYFITGDMCQYSKEKKLFKMLGRKSTDMIKTGGYRVSALEVETHLMEHPDIIECAVVPIKDDTWGEIVAAVLVVNPGSDLTLDSLRTWSETKMADYAVPKIIKTVDILPRNAMGKINKKDLTKALFE